MRSFTLDERRARLARRHHLATGLPAVSADALTATLVGLHATDPATPYLSLWARIPGCSVADVHAALYEHRTLVKHLAMRRTLWVVRPGDLPSIQSAASDRVAANEHRRLVADAERAGVAADGQAWLEAARKAVLGHLGRTGACTARQLREALPELTGTYDPAPGKSWGGEGHLAPRVLTLLSARGDIVRGPNDGGWTTSRPRWVAAGDWLDPADAVAPEAARAEMVRRWLYAFGPATVTDVKWWFGNTLGWARQALRDIEAVEVDMDGTPGFVLPGDDEPGPRGGAVVCVAARSGRHDDGMVRPRLVSGPAPQPGLRPQRQRGPHGVGRRPRRGRVAPGRRWPRRAGTARRSRPSGP